MRGRLLRCLPLAALLLGGVVPASAQTVRGAPLDPGGVIRIWLLSGSVRVIGWDADSVAVRATLHGDARLMFGGARAGVKIGLQETVSDQSADLVVHVPRRAQLWVKGADTRIEVEGMREVADLYSVTGAIAVTGAPDRLFIESIGGTVTVAGAPSVLRVKSGNGPIRLDGGGDDVTLTTVSGSVTVTGGPILRGRFESVTGDVRFAASLAPGAATDFINHSGAVELSLPGRLGARFALNTFKGRVRSDFGMGDATTRRETRGEELVFTTGSPDAEIGVRTFSGDIVLRRK